MLAFVHIEKTAGTSIIHFLRNAFFPHYADVRPLGRGGYRYFSAEDLRKYRRIVPGLKAIAGHSIVPHGDLGDAKDIEFFTFLRDPVQRFLSQYRYWRRHLRIEISFEDFVGLPHTHNKQVCKIAGEPSLQKAIDIIEEKFLFVGLVERMRDDLSALCDSIGLQSNKRVLFNLNTGESSKPSGVPEDLAFLEMEGVAKECNLLDQGLYEYIAKKTFVSEDSTLVLPGSKSPPLLYLDYFFRKCYISPVTGAVRVFNGRSARGSY